MANKVTTIDINSREVPATYHDALRNILKGLKKKQISLEAGYDAYGYSYEAYKDVSSVFGYFLTAAEKQRVDSNDQYFSTVEKAQDLRRYLGVNKLELQTIFGMNNRDLNSILKKHHELIDANCSYGVSITNRSFRHDLKAFIYELLLSKANYDNPGLN